jgi:branched-chain amino acid transport system substrate-binding protein
MTTLARLDTPTSGNQRHQRWARLFFAFTMVFGVFVAFGASDASAAGGPIKIVLITSRTGPAGPEYSTAQIGFLARVALQNAHGGIDGRKIEPIVIDDQTSPTDVVTATQDAISKGALGIVAVTPVFFAAAKFPQQAGIPVTGSYADGPEWGEQPYTNMFAADNGSVDPKYPVNTGIATFLKAHGGTVLGVYAYGISPSSVRQAEGAADAFKRLGGKVGVLDTSIPFGSVSFTNQALAAKEKDVNAVWGVLDNDSNFSLATSFQQAGIRPKVVLFPTGYDPSVIGSTVWKSLQGDYFVTEFRPFSVPNVGTTRMAGALQRYEHFSKSTFPTFGQYESWVGADLMIEGIQKAGKNPTPAGVITALRSIRSYTGGGLLPYSINYSTIFGHDIRPDCVWFVKAEAKGFVPTSAKPSCGKDVPGTSTASP